MYERQRNLEPYKGRSLSRHPRMPCHTRFMRRRSLANASLAEAPRASYGGQLARPAPQKYRPIGLPGESYRTQGLKNLRPKRFEGSKFFLRAGARC